MKKAFLIRGVVVAGVVLCLGWLGFSVFKKSRGPAMAEAPKTVSETRYFRDVSSYFYSRVPFLKKGLRFIDSSISQGNQEGGASSLMVQNLNSGAGAESLAKLPLIHTTKDFAPFVNAIKTEREALTYVMFLNRKGFPWMEPIRFDYFQDVPFTSIEFVTISSATRAGNSIHVPKISVVNEKGGKKKHFSIVRTVIPLDQPSLAEEKILSGSSFLLLSELGEVTETVAEDGTYSYTLRRFPVKNCPIENPLRALRKSRK